MARLRSRGRRFGLIPGSPLAVLVAALSGTRYVYDGAVNVANSGGVANGTWTDATGAGPALVMGKGAGAYPTYDAVNGLIATDGSQNYFESALDSGLDLGGNSCTIAIVEHTGAGQSLYISDGTTGKYLSLGVDAGGFKVTSAGLTAGSDPAANANITNGATRRMLMVARTNDYELAPAGDPIQPSANVYTEYAYADVYPYPRSWSYLRHQFASGSMKLTGGRNPAGASYIAASYATIIHMDHRPTMDEQDALRTYFLARGGAHPAQKKMLFTDGNSVPAAFNAGSVNYAYWLMQSPPAGYAARGAARSAAWAHTNFALASSGRQGQWISDPHAGGTSVHTITRLSDLVLSAKTVENADAVLVFDEIINDLTFTSGLTNQQRADVAIASIQSAVTKAVARGIKPIVKTMLKTVTGASGITPWDITGSAGARGGRESQRALVNDYLRANWRAMGIWRLWDAAGNYLIRQPTNAPYYDGIDFSHPLQEGHYELAWGRGDAANGNAGGLSAYDASYNAAYLVQTGVDLAIDGPFYVGLDSVLWDGGL